MLPAIVGYDGWETSHASVKVQLPSQEEVDRFLPTSKFIHPERDYMSPDWKEKFSHRRRQHGFGSASFMEIRYLQKKAEADSIQKIIDVGKEYQATFGRHHAGVLETYRCEDADIILITMGIVYPSVKFVVNALRQKGIKIGGVKLRAFRPFPGQALCETIQNAKVVMTLERNSLAALFTELKAALYSFLGDGSNRPSPAVMGRIVGIGGRPIPLENIGHIAAEGLQALQNGQIEKVLNWYPLKPIDYDPTRDTIAE